MLRRLSFFALILLVTGCGFKLRGMVDMPLWLNNIAIVTQQGHRDLAPLIKEQLEAYHRRVVSDPGQATYLLIIENDLSQQLLTSVSSSTTPRQYQLIYTVQYSVVKTNGAPIIASNTVTITRQLTVNNDRILGSDSESAVIYREMHKDAVIQLINRLSKKSTPLPLAAN